MQNVSHYSSNYKRSIALGILSGLLLGGVFVGGFFLRDVVDSRMPVVMAQSETEDDATGYPLLDEVQSILDTVYFRDQPDAKAREYAAIRGMLLSLDDRYTYFIEPPVAQSESDVLAGTYGGIGVLIQRNEAGEIALFPFPDSPAAEAGIEDGAILVAINTVPLDVALPQDQIDQMLRGEVKEGSGVELTVRKADTGEEFTAFIPFAVINVPSVVWRVLAEDEDIGYVQILRFTARTPEELKTALSELRAEEVAALIVDLRNNSGGLLQESIDVADEFVDADVLVYEVDAAGEEPFNGTRGGLAADLPLVVLVNQNTASGAELVAGAIRDQDRGILVGQQTYGKGTVQQIFPLSDGSSLHVTSAEWLTPDRRVLSDTGLQPDIAMIPDANGRDVELGEAIRQLQGLLG